MHPLRLILPIVATAALAFAAPTPSPPSSPHPNGPQNSHSNGSPANGGAVPQQRHLQARLDEIQAELERCVGEVAKRFDAGKITFDETVEQFTACDAAYNTAMAAARKEFGDWERAQTDGDGDGADDAKSGPPSAERPMNAFGMQTSPLRRPTTKMFAPASLGAPGEEIPPALSVGGAALGTAAAARSAAAAGLVRGAVANVGEAVVAPLVGGLRGWRLVGGMS